MVDVQPFNIIQGAIHRLFRATSNWKAFHEALTKNNEIWERNEYPRNWVGNIVKHTINQPQMKPQKNDITSCKRNSKEKNNTNLFSFSLCNHWVSWHWNTFFSKKIQIISYFCPFFFFACLLPSLINKSSHNVLSVCKEGTIKQILRAKTRLYNFEFVFWQFLLFLSIYCSFCKRLKKWIPTSPTMRSRL